LLVFQELYFFIFSSDGVAPIEQTIESKHLGEKIQTRFNSYTKINRSKSVCIFVALFDEIRPELILLKQLNE
jgi:hypothetical protein